LGAGYNAPMAARRLSTGRSLSETCLRLALWAVVVLPPLVVVPTAIDVFRLPKLLAAELLGLLSLVVLALRLRDVPRAPGRVWRSPALLAILPLLLVASLGLVGSDHREHVWRALASFWIGAACLVGWSLGFACAELRRYLAGVVAPASLLAALGILQYHGGFQPFAFVGIRPGERLEVTSLAGNAGDLGAYLALAALLAQERAVVPGRRRWAWAAAALLCAYGVVVSQTLTAIVALLAGSALLWLLLLPRRRAWAAVALAPVLAAAVLVAVPGLRQRAGMMGQALRTGDLGFILSHRLDGWRAALWMLRRHPWTGVGHGAYVTEYSPAKLALLERGEVFSSYPGTATFEHSHSEYLQVAAELGWPGVVALIWGVGWLARGARRRSAGGPRALAWALLALLALLAAAHFPFRLALTGYPALLVLAWLLRDEEEAAGPPPVAPQVRPGKRAARRR
jgi:O-antigen ligase